MHVDTVLLKVASRCNLDCSYCYVYHMGDENWRTLPKRMAADTQELVVAELRALMRAQGWPFSIVLHGGEPLLLGLPRLESLFKALRDALGDACGTSIQTNGVLITNAVLDLCAAHNVTLSVSLDGPSAVHDRFRVDLRQRPTHAQVVAGLQRLQSHPAAERLFSGVLCVVDPTSNPEVVYDYFKGLGVPSVDFLYRDGNHTVLPFGKAAANSTEYGAWMCRILDRYVADASPFRSRLLDDMMRLLLGGVGGQGRYRPHRLRHLGYRHRRGGEEERHSEELAFGRRLRRCLGAWPQCACRYRRQPTVSRLSFGATAELADLPGVSAAEGLWRRDGHPPVQGRRRL